MTFEQISIFDELIKEPDADERQELLESAMLQTHMAGSRVRIFAMIASGEWPQYAINWLKDEYGTGGFSMCYSPGCFCDYSGKGLKIWSRYDHKEFKYTWNEALKAINNLIDRGDYLLHSEERIIERIIQERGKLPYPRARLAYPQEAWEDYSKIFGKG